MRILIIILLGLTSCHGTWIDRRLCPAGHIKDNACVYVNPECTNNFRPCHSVNYISGKDRGTATWN